jgi:Uncharacterised nucleotidyltransferase
MQGLLELLRGHRVDLSRDQPEWEQALALAEEEHILPWIARLCERQASVAPGLRSRLDTIARDGAITAFYWGSELKAILRAFDQQNVVVVPLKGPFLAERLYGETALRVNYDLDLLVSKRDLTRAEAALSALGYTPDTPDDYHRQWYRDGTSVELHHDVENPLAFNFHIARVLERIQPAAFLGQRCWQLAPSDELLFLCLHGVRHRFERLSLIVDLCLAFERLSVSGVAPPQPEVAERSSLLALGLAMARRLRPEINDPLCFNASPAQIKHLDGLADRLWRRLLTQPSEPLDWRAVHSFYLELELPGHRMRRRWHYLQILHTRVIKPDYEFAARFGCTRPWQVRLLRPLRLFKDAMQNLMSRGHNHSHSGR